MSEANQIVIYDLDGTLLDDSERIKASLEDIGIPEKTIDTLTEEEGEKFDKIYHSAKYLDLDKPIQLQIENLKKDADEYTVWIVSGRHKDMSKATKKQLDNFDIPYDNLELLSIDIEHIKQVPETKKQFVQKLIDKGAEIVKYVDDDENVIEALKEVLPEERLIVASGIKTEKIEEEQVEIEPEQPKEKPKIKAEIKTKTPEQQLAELALPKTETDEIDIKEL